MVAQAILAMMTSFGYMYVQVRKKDGKTVVDANRKPVKDRIIQWEDFEEMQGKDRTGVLGERTRNVTLRQIRQRMEQADDEIRRKREESK